jgi:hypothetical protein
MSRPNLNLNDFMGLFRSGFLALLVAGATTLAQQPVPAPGGPAPTPPPGVPDTTAPAPAIQPEPTPGVDPNAIQPAPIGADTNAPAAAPSAKPKPKKAVAPALPTLRGTVGSIDKNAMTIVIHGKSKDETLNITSKTHIFADNKPAILADAKEGENVTAEYRNTKEKTKEALTLRFGGSGSPAHSVSAPKDSDHKAEAKPAAKKSTKASAKKKKKTPAKDNAAPGAETPTVTPLPESVPPPVPTPQPGTPAPAPGTPGTNP